MCKSVKALLYWIFSFKIYFIYDDFIKAWRVWFLDWFLEEILSVTVSGVKKPKSYSEYLKF